MHMMKPLFMLDTKTQRGFMACLKLDDIEMALTEETILLEIKLATLQYYFNVCRYSSQVKFSMPYPLQIEIIDLAKTLAITNMSV